MNYQEIKNKLAKARDAIDVDQLERADALIRAAKGATPNDISKALGAKRMHRMRNFERMKPSRIDVTVSIEAQWFVDTWLSAAIHYWASESVFDGKLEPDGTLIEWAKFHVRERHPDDPKYGWHVLDWERAIRIAVTEKPWLLNDPDAPACDALVQLAAFGEIRYG